MADDLELRIEDDAILDYDDFGDDFIFSSDDEDDKETVVEPQEYPETPQERITWQEKIRMIHLRSHLNQMTEKLKHASYLVDKTREELKKCRAQKQFLENERDSLFRQIQEQEDVGNQASLYRLRAAHDRACLEIDEELKLEARIKERLEQTEYDLAVVEVERGKFMIAEDELIQQEQRLFKEKMQIAQLRVQKEQRLAKMAGTATVKAARLKTEALKDQERKHRHAIEEANRSYERASKYLNKTLEKMRQRQLAEQDRYNADMKRKMEMLFKLKQDITANKENLKAIRARDKASERKAKEKEDAERKQILAEGGNPDFTLQVKKHLNEREHLKQKFQNEQEQNKVEIVSRILAEEKYLKKRKKTHPHLWNGPAWEKSLRVLSHKPKTVKMLKEYMESTALDAKEFKPPLRPESPDDDEKQDKEKDIEDETLEHTACSSSSNSEPDDAETVNLAMPEFQGLWEHHKPYKVPKDVDRSQHPPGCSKMDKEILQKVLQKHRKGIIVKQVAAGREFSGRPFNSKPKIIHFKDFDVGTTYKKKVVLTNVSYTINYCKFMSITERLKDFIKIEFECPGQMSAGMTCEMLVTFSPMINEDLIGEINFLSQTGEFSVPLHCTTKKCDLLLDVKKIDFGTVVIGETIKHSFTLINKGALGTKFDFFKVTGQKQRTLTTGGTSIGRLTTASIRGLSPESDIVTDKPNLAGNVMGKVEDTNKKSQDLEITPETVGGAGVTKEIGLLDGNERTDIAISRAQTGDIFSKGDQDLGEALSPDLAVSEMDDYNLDGMHAGPPVSGEIGPFSSTRLEIVWQPTIPGKVESEFLVTFADPLSDGLSIRATAVAIDVPVWVERQTIDLRICMFDRLYQDTVIVKNRATTALKLKFEVCKELSNHLEILPRTGYIQAQSKFSAQLKFLPRQSLFEDATKYFDRNTGVLDVPVIIRVADQTSLVQFMVNAVVTTSDLEFDVKDIDFGYCTVYESVLTTVHLTNKSILPQEFGFLGLPEFVEVQPNDGFGTVLPLETIELEVIFSPRKAHNYKFELVCKSLINREFKISCLGIGVLPPLQLSHQMVQFAATALFDRSVATFHVINSHTSKNEFTHPVPRIGDKGEICPVGPTSFEFVVPKGIPLSVSPAVGTVEPGKKVLVHLYFTPILTEEEIYQQAVRVSNKLENAQKEKEREETTRLEAMEQKAALNKGLKSGKAAATPKLSKLITSSFSKVPSFSALDAASVTNDSLAYTAAMGSLLRQFGGRFSKVFIPCYVASGKTGNPGELPYSIHNTLYLEVHCPVVKPDLVVISDNGKTMIDFGEMSIGQSTTRTITFQNISDHTVQLKSSILSTMGPFEIVNALRSLQPDATHTMIVKFTPYAGHIFQEPLEIRTASAKLHLTLIGRGVSPVVTLSLDGPLLDLGAVLVGEFCEKTFKIQNTSSLAIDYVIKFDSLSPLRYSKAQAVPHFLQPESKSKQYVGMQNNNGLNVFDMVPHEGTIPAGGSKEITVTFAPDHESSNYSDGVHIELFNQKESHFFQVKGQGRLHIMYMEGGDPLYPDVESLGVVPSLTSVEEESKPPPIPLLLTLRSRIKNEEFLPASQDVYIGCVRTMAVSQKKNGEFQFENIQLLTQKGFTVDPQKAMVEAGTRKAVTITWTPPQGYDPSKIMEEKVLVTLKGDIVEQYQVMLRAMAVSE